MSIVGWSLSEVIHRVSLEGFPIETRLSVKKGEIVPGTVSRKEILVVEMKTKHRDNPEHPWTVATEQEAPRGMYQADFYFSKDAQLYDFLQWVRMTIWRVLEHELTEQFKFDGRRYFHVKHTEDEKAMQAKEET